ncbi:WD repeat containing planar cell polarity effector [Cricetulus griseus]
MYLAHFLQVLSCVRTEGNPLDVHFGTKQPYHVCTVECSISVDKEPMADSCVYECVRNKLHCMSVTRIPLRSKAISCCRNPTEDKLIVGCEDSSVILYEAHRGVTLLAQAELLPSLISCHPSGAILLVGSNQGELQIFDIALSPINIQLLAEDRLPSKTLQFNKFFDVSSNLVQMQWIAPPVVSQKPERGEIYDLLFLRFNRGPVGVLLFKLAQLEASLGTFYAPARPLLDTTVLEYRDQISKYARRFFHHLLRYRRFEKAFLLAVDIGARDLFMDIHYLALDMGELALAEVARRRACDIDVESVSSGIELLGPLDKRDTLNEAFAGPAPEGENTFPDLLPSTGSKHRHVIQQKIPNGPSNRQAIDRRNEQEGKSRTDSSVTTISDAEGGLKEDCRGQDIGDVGSLRMVHFGLV